MQLEPSKAHLPRPTFPSGDAGPIHARLCEGCKRRPRRGPGPGLPRHRRSPGAGLPRQAAAGLGSTGGSWPGRGDSRSRCPAPPERPARTYLLLLLLLPLPPPPPPRSHPAARPAGLKAAAPKRWARRAAAEASAAARAGDFPSCSPCPASSPGLCSVPWACLS